MAGSEQASRATAGCLFFTYLAVVIGPPLFGQLGSWAGSLGTAYAALAVPLLWTLWMLGGRWQPGTAAKS